MSAAATASGTITVTHSDLNHSGMTFLGCIEDGGIVRVTTGSSTQVVTNSNSIIGSILQIYSSGASDYLQGRWWIFSSLKRLQQIHGSTACLSLRPRCKITANPDWIYTQIEYIP